MPRENATWQRRSFRALFALAALFALVMLPHQGSAHSQQSSSGHKILVDAQDQALIATLKQSGAQLLVDYGAFALWRTATDLSPSLLDHASVATLDESDSIGLRDGAIDTSAGVSMNTANLRQERSAGEQFWMVQFVGPVKDSWLDALRGAGLELVMYMPSNAYVVWGDAAALANLDALAASSPVIQWTGAYRPAYRLAPELQGAQLQRAADMVNVTVQFYTMKTTDQSLAQLRALGGTVYQEPSELLGLTNITLQLPASQLAAVAAWADVFNVEPWSAPKKLDEAQGQIMAGNVATSAGKTTPTGPGYLAWLASKGFPTTPASYPIIDVVDDGLDRGDAANIAHPDFHEQGQIANPSRVVYIGNCTSDATGNAVGGHGNLNAGIVAAYNNLSGSPHQDANGYRLGLGISPYGRVAGTKIFQNTGPWDVSHCGNSMAGLVQSSYNAGATITSNSWGASAGGAYTADSQAYDALTRDASDTTAGNQQMLHVFSAGNDGSGANTIGTPASAKNVLSVGATENVRDNGIADGCNVTDGDNADDIAWFSSRGPTQDQRVKPDIVAPGTHVQGPASQDPGFNASGVCGGASSSFYPGGQTLYTWSSGTSHSTPAVAGAASLLYEYYSRVLKPGQSPSPAMLKALLLNTPRYLNGSGSGDTLPSNNQGWGDVNLGALFDNTIPRQLVDQSVVFDATGQQFEASWAVADPSKPLRVSLVWTDAPGSTTGNSYVNNLDLEVVAGGTSYKGNVFSGANSTSGGAFDTRNNVENVFLPAGTSSAFTVRVVARNIAGDGIPGNSDSTDQDFALVVSNVNTGTSTAHLASSGVRWSDAAGNNNGVVDPGEMVALQIDLTNIGNLPATGISSVATVTSGSATAIRPNATYSDIPDGATRTNPLDLLFHVSPTQPCNSTITIEDVITYNTGQTLTISTIAQLGTPTAGTPVNYAYNGGNLPISNTSPATASIIVPTTANVGDVNVRFSALHTYDRDMVISLTSPTGTTVVLSNQRGGSGDNYTNTVFDDEAATAIGSGSPPFTGSFRPDQSLSVFDDQPMNGTWQLTVVDKATGDSGTLQQFQLDISPREYACQSVTTDPIAGLAASNNSPTGLGSTTTLTATITGGTNVAYAWNFGDGSSSTGANPSHTYTAIGTYTATVTATNPLGSVTATTTVQIRDVAIAGLSATNNGPTTLGGSTALAAAINAGTNVSYAWDFGDGTTGTGANPSHTYTARGSYTATVAATNSRGTVTASTTVEVRDVAISGLSASNISPRTAGNPVSLKATVATGSNVVYSWDFGDGETGVGATPTHIYYTPGQYTATVTATNSGGAATANTTVIVWDAPFIIVAASNDGPKLPGSPVSFKTRVAGGTNLSYSWDFGDGTTGTGVNPTHTYSTVGTYTVTVTVTNALGSATTTTTVDVYWTTFVPIVLR